MSTPASPAIHDPVVIEGMKYRIVALDSGPFWVDGKEYQGLAQLRTSFGGHVAAVALSALVWDDIAGLWREAAR